MTYKYDINKMKDREEEPEFGTEAYCKEHGGHKFHRSIMDDITYSGMVKRKAFACRRCGEMRHERTGY